MPQDVNKAPVLYKIKCNHLYNALCGLLELCGVTCSNPLNFKSYCGRVIRAFVTGGTWGGARMCHGVGVVCQLCTRLQLTTVRHPPSVNYS